MAEPSADRLCLVCSCEDTMPLDLAALARAGHTVQAGEQLCRGQLERVRAAFATGRPLTIGCTQESPLFLEEAEAAQAPAPAFANLRETAGWAIEARAAGPKMAALLAVAAITPPATSLVQMESRGVCLVLGRDQVAVDAAARLEDRLDLTVLLTGAIAVAPPRRSTVPLLRGRARAATGWLGAFAVTIDGHATAAPSSRTELRWGPARDGATSQCDLILDLSGGPALFPAAPPRSGYLRADPDDAAAVARAVFEAGNLVGSFDAPRFVTVTPGLCAHSRNRRVGCTRCLDLCPAGAIAPAGDAVAVTAEICAGCGACAAACPTGAITYALPTPGTVLARQRAAIRAFVAAGGADPVLLLHDTAHGEALIDALARHGDGLPARVIPIGVNEATQLDLAALAAPLAWGAAAVRVLLPGRRPHGVEGVLRNLELLGAALAGLGLAGAVPRAAAIETDDPFTLAAALVPAAEMRAVAQAGFLPLGDPREVALLALRALADAAGPEAPPRLTLPPLAPFGAAVVQAEGCTLCLACTMVCPTGAFSANPDHPELRFTEAACVQCGLCVATCPERVITLAPGLDLTPAAATPMVVKREEPAVCPRCDKAFGTRASLARVKAKLAGSGHWMFADPARLAVLDLCEDCRVFEATSGGMDPYAGPARPVTRTAADYRDE